MSVLASLVALHLLQTRPSPPPPPPPPHAPNDLALLLRHALPPQPPAPPGTGTGMLGGSAVVVGGGLLVIVLGAAGLVRRWHALAVGVKPGEGEGDELLVTEGEGRSGSLHKEVAEAVEVERAWRVHRPAGGRNRETVEDMAAEWD